MIPSDWYEDAGALRSAVEFIVNLPTSALPEARRLGSQVPPAVMLRLVGSARSR